MTQLISHLNNCKPQADKPHTN